MSASKGDGTDAALTLGEFLRTQAQEAGLSAREIARAFQQRADREQARIAAGAGGPVEPVDGMSFSKSHLDRLFKSGAVLPSIRFLGVFLEITSAAAGLSSQRHQTLCREATELLTKARRLRARSAALPQPRLQPEPPTTAAAIATLQAQLDLERAHRTGDRLRRELSDTQALMGTLLQIIEALRDIITELDLDLFGAPRTAGRTVPRSLAERQRTEAVEYKAVAEAEYGRVDYRRRALELLWDQAQGNLRRLAAHADVGHLRSLPDLPLLPPRSVLSPGLHAEPALADIATALGQVQEYNDAEEQKISELRRALVDNAPLAPDDELAILVAATRLSDPLARNAALRTVLVSWAHHPSTRDTLLRLVHDDQPAIRCSAAWGLAAAWAGNPEARDAVAALAGDPEHRVRQMAALGLVHGWAGDHAARDALARLVQHEDAGVRHVVMQALVQGWADDPVVRDCLIALSCDSEVLVRAIAAEFLAEGWTDDGVAHAVLSSLCDDPAESIRWIARQGLARQGYTPATSSVTTNAILQAVELPPSYQELGTLPVAEALRQGINFHEGITVLVGANGTGKTILLEALALSMNSKRSALPIGQPSSASKDLAKHLQITWNGQRTSYSCHYLTDRTVPARDRYASRLKQWQFYLRSLVQSDGAPNRIIFIDEPGFLDSMAEREIFDALSELADQGFQLIVTSARAHTTALSVARVIEIDRSAHRPVAFDPAKLPDGPALLM
ncbi:HEAT repeat domain-containing protein [Streptacidiphilus sp. P02-A3a]|uniref:HEAT repeat domain-containing protein n=1 Tax=Streptacidiphilus sp. P02-A3a TaxID=2704468 RepID=UPI0015F9CB14|nr:HEAT repeat domain-containing protein [Streptacidiphilus sp. P02-A3a]QMU72927.1 AAA family ATPase [Streptacidiphilus sp. P02-A3a]